MHPNEVVIASALITPIDLFGGSLKNISAVQLGSIVIKAVIEQAGIHGDQIEQRL
ncbi:hypothetical protein [Metabacillus sp. FJAT-53654]|uniref:Thiolase N-terminal domain-containing protein n=1 Tax=Metabacillus rhizosphaerae TaxID=3117747 RepID=A0ABZ2MSG9_9BACI